MKLDLIPDYRSSIDRRFRRNCSAIGCHSCYSERSNLYVHTAWGLLSSCFACKDAVPKQYHLLPTRLKVLTWFCLLHLLQMFENRTTECWTLRKFMPFFCKSDSYAHHLCIIQQRLKTHSLTNPTVSLETPWTPTSVGAPVNSSKASEVSPPLMKR